MNVAPINTLAGIGHNLPPLDEQIAEEIAADKRRAAELLAAAVEARIANDDDAAKIVTLVALLRSHEKALDQAREQRKRPFLENCRIVDQVYGAVIRPLAVARAGTDGRSGLAALLTVWQRRKEEEARRERERIEAECREREAEAERARQAAEAARAAGTGTVAAELAAIRAADEAERLAREVATIRPEPIRSNAGAVAMRREIAFELTDLRKALGWLVKHRPGEVGQAARTIIGSHLRSMGVDAAATADIPGVTVTIASRAQVR